MSERKATRKSSANASKSVADTSSSKEKLSEAAAAAEDHELDSPSRRRLPPLLRLAWYSLNQAFRRRINDLGITPDQFTILRWLTECDPQWPTQRELGAMMASDPNTITSLLRRMEKAEVVIRQPHETDRRANRIQITAAGKRIYFKARQIAIDLQTEILAPLSETKRDEFFQLLDVVAQSCRQSLGGTPVETDDE